MAAANRDLPVAAALFLSAAARRKVRGCSGRCRGDRDVGPPLDAATSLLADVGASLDDAIEAWLSAGTCAKPCVCAMIAFVVTLASWACAIGADVIADECLSCVECLLDFECNEDLGCAIWTN